VNLTEAQLDGRACVHCGDEHSAKRLVEAWSEQSAQVFECSDVEACADRRHECGHWRRGPIRADDSQECLDCGLVFVSDG